MRKLLRETRLIRPPKKLLSTFGDTRIEYHMVSPLEDMPNKARLRQGCVVSERPRILTPDALKERFEGFGDDAEQFADWLGGQYHDILRALEYRFKNKDRKTRVLARAPHATAMSIQRDVDSRDIPHAAVIECPNAAWPLALMRLTLEEASKSFPTNVKDLDNHGLFDPGSNERRRQRHEVEELLVRAARGAGTRDLLGAKLREYGLFAEYEDRFLSLYG